MNQNNKQSQTSHSSNENTANDTHTATNRPTANNRRGGGHGPGGNMAALAASGKTKKIMPTIKRSFGMLIADRLRFAVVFITAVLAVATMVAGPKLLGNATNTIFEGVISKTITAQVLQKLETDNPAIKGISDAQKDKLLATVTKDKLLNQLKNTGQEQQAEMLKDMNITLKTSAGIDFNKLGSQLLFVLFIYILSFLMYSSTNWITNTMVNRMAAKLRGQIARKLNTLPLSYFDTNTKGDIMSRTANDLDNLSNALNQTASQILTSLFQIGFILVMMLSISWELTIIALLVVPVSFLVITFLMKKAQPMFVKQWKITGDLNGFIEDAFTGHTEIRLNRQQYNQMQQFDEINEQLCVATTKAQFLSGLIGPINQFFSNMGYVLIAIIAGLRVASGNIMLGDMQAFIQYSRQFSMPLGQIAGMMNMLQSGMASAERVFEVLDTVDEVDAVDVLGDAVGDDITTMKKTQQEAKDRDKADANTDLHLDTSKPIVEFDNVEFSYSPDKPLIRNFNLKVWPKQTIAIVGPTGAGKTTIINLLMRFYDIKAGSIKLYGRDIRQISRHQLRAFFGMVLQDTWMFDGSIEENIKYGLPLNSDINEKDFLDVTRSTSVDTFVRKFPGGYQMPYNDENSILSQGEKQLLTIARASVSNPEILILDEATSSVDTRTEVLVYEAMNKLQENRTSFVIAHRLSTIRNADIIIYIKDGQIVEQGSQKELLANPNGEYSKLFNSQFADADN